MHSLAPAAASPAALGERPPTAELALRRAGIAGIGAALPAEVVSNAPIAAALGVSEDWIVARTGVRERRRAAAGDSLAGLAAAAGRAALSRAGITPEDVDLVLVATLTPDAVMPNAAPLVAQRLGARRAGALDVGAACTGFLGAVALAAGQVEAGRARTVLAIGAELMSRVTDAADKRTAALFGDGAGAAVISEGGSGVIGPVVMGADGSQADCVTLGHDDRRVRMRGQDTFRHAVARLSQSTREAVEAAGTTLERIDLFVYHQANARILAAVGERLGLPSDRVVSCIDRYGNTSAASIPIALAEADEQGLLRPGARVLVSAFGAGLTWGSGVIEWR